MSDVTDDGHSGIMLITSSVESQVPNLTYLTYLPRMCDMSPEQCNFQS